MWFGAGAGALYLLQRASSKGQVRQQGGDETYLHATPPDRNAAPPVIRQGELDQ
jgi:hypothetical protein